MLLIFTLTCIAFVEFRCTISSALYACAQRVNGGFRWFGIIVREGAKFSRDNEIYITKALHIWLTAFV